MGQVYKIDTGIAELLLVRIPEDLRFYKNDVGITGISESQGKGIAKYIDNIIIDNISSYAIMGRLSDLSNGQVETFVAKQKKEQSDTSGPIWKNYSDDGILITAWQSLYSCILVNGLLTREPKKPHFSAMQLVSPAVDTDTPVQQYKKDMDRYINSKTTLVLKKVN